MAPISEEALSEKCNLVPLGYTYRDIGHWVGDLPALTVLVAT
jgi:hypothetical protein